MQYKQFLMFYRYNGLFSTAEVEQAHSKETIEAELQ